jgi:hypothetical protein
MCTPTLNALAGLRWRRLAPGGLVGIPVVFNLWVLRAETTQVHNLNDSALHLALTRWARNKIDQGKLPLDGWVPYLSLGSPQFHHYQTLSHVVTAYASTFLGLATTYSWGLYLLLALWPVSVYMGTRLLGWDRWIAATAALVSPLLVSVSGYGFEHSSYTWRGLGMWPQLWAMWLLPLAWGLSWRAVNQGRSLALAALAIALTIGSHFMTGSLALLVLVPWVVADPSQLKRRLVRAVVVGGGALLIASWTLIPLIADRSYQGNLEFFQGFWLDSYGAPQVLQWLFTGQLYDSGRLPVVTVLVGVGLAACIANMRTDLRARALVAAWGLSLVLFFGRPALGPLLKILPGSDDLQLHRYINGVHLAGLMLAAVGAVWLARFGIGLVRRIASRVPIAAVAAGVALLAAGVLYPAWSQVADSDTAGGDLIAAQQQADATDGAELAVLIDRVKAAGDGRGYAGTRTNWGKQYTVGYVPVYSELENADVAAIGMWLQTESLSSDVEVRFDERNPADYDLFNIRYLLLPEDHPPSVPATLLMRSGRHTLWQVATSGYLEVVDSVGPPIVADRHDIGAQTAAFMESDQLRRHQFPTVAFDGRDASAPSLSGESSPSDPPGTVLTQSSSPADGMYRGEVVTNRVAVVLLKTTYDPRWQVTVDGIDVEPSMVAPTFIGQQVSPGRHVITFRYAPYPHYSELLALGILTLLGLALWPTSLLSRVRIPGSWRPRRGRGPGPLSRH